jgi:hypothetical protein
VFSIAERLGVSTEAVEGHAWQWACMLRCAVPGIVKSFSAEKQTCSSSYTGTYIKASTSYFSSS